MRCLDRTNSHRATLFRVLSCDCGQLPLLWALVSPLIFDLKCYQQKKHFGVDKTRLPQNQIIQLCHPKGNGCDPILLALINSSSPEPSVSMFLVFFLFLGGRGRVSFQQENRQLFFSCLTPLDRGIGMILFLAPLWCLKMETFTLPA